MERPDKLPNVAYVFRSEDQGERESIGTFPAYAVPRLGELICFDTGEVRVVSKVAWFAPNGNTNCIAMVDTDSLTDTDSKWPVPIQVSERLPELGVPVLCYVPGLCRIWSEDGCDPILIDAADRRLKSE